MTERRYTTTELVREIRHSYARLRAGLDRFSISRMTDVKDAQGWSVKDHLIHLAAWERSVVYLLQGKPRHEGLGIDRELYMTGGIDDDPINAVIHEKTAGVALDGARRELDRTTEQLIGLISSMPYGDLYRPNYTFLPDAQGERDERAVIGTIRGNTSEHFDEHLRWIRELVGEGE